MADGSIILDVDLNEADAVARLQKIKTQIMKLREDQAVNLELRSNAEAKVAQIAAQLDAAKAKLAQMQDAGIGGQALAEQQERVKMLQAEFDAASRAVDKYNAALDAGEAKMSVLQQEAGELAATLSTGGDQASASMEQVGAAAETAGDQAQEGGQAGADGMKTFADATDHVLTRIKNLAKRVLFFSVITAGFRALKKYISAALQENEEFQKALAGIKGALESAFMPIFTSIIPWITALINILARAVTIISSLVGAVFGFSSGLKSTAKNLKDAGKAGGGAAKSFAAFDEINQLSDGGGGGGGAGGDIMEFDLQSKVSEYEEILGGALLVIGAILAFSGVNIPLGIALMAAGALTLASAAGVDWEKLKRYIAENRDTIQKILSGAALVLGAILAFSSINIPLGIALMAIGAVGLAKAAGLNWDRIRQFIAENLHHILAALAAAVLVIGIIIAFADPAHMALGIALIVAGAAGLAAEVALNWDAIKTYIAKNKDEISKMLMIGAAAMIVLGIILVAAGPATMAMGIALLVAGAGSLVAAIALNWDAIKEKVKEVWEGIKQWWDTDVAPIFTVAYWKDKFQTIVDGLKEKVNDAISLVEQALNWIIGKANTISFDIPEGVPLVGGTTWGINIPQVHIPRLAQGAVIPPNREFLATLGDQKSGVNIETPLETMVAAFRQALSDGGAGRDITVVLELDGQSFGRAVYRANNDEMQRVGLRLVGG